MSERRGEAEVLHYLGYDDDRGGIVSVVRALAGTGQFHCWLGLNAGARQRCAPPLPQMEFAPVRAETIGSRLLWRTWPVARRVRTWLRAEDGRVFHGHSRAGLLVALWLHLAGERRVVASVHSFGRQRWFYRQLARRLGPRLLWLGPAMKQYYGVGGADWDGCIPDCVPLALQPAAARVAGAGGEVRFGCVGGLVRVKEWDVVLRALAQLPADPPIRVRHAGEEDGTAASAAYARELRELTARLGVASRIAWGGASRDMAGYLAGIDCLVVASGREASSVAALEAMAAGIPVLAADRAGTRDLIAETDGGWLFRTGDPADLAQRMQELATSGALRVKRIPADRLQRFSADVVAAQCADLYRQVSAFEGKQGGS